ncbi:MAG TPA: hypothetical protein VLJ60_03510, partial [bacterium]|nr:hypothetical protein [bacterium]
EYEAISSDDDKSGLFTYRVDVTEFMKEIIKSGEEKDIKSSGDSLYGGYNVKGLDCTNNEIYITTSGMVAGWALVFVYTSQKIRPKNIYFYNGMDAYRFSENVLDINGFELPDKAEVKLTMIVAEGDAGLASATTDAFQAAPPEGLSLKGQSVADFNFLYNICNPSKNTPLNYIEVYNSISSVYGWSDETPVCVGGDPLKPDPEGLEYAIDVDTFLIKAGEYPFDKHLKEGDTSFSIKIGTNQDQIYTNLLILGVETKIEEEVQDSDDAENSDYDNNSNDEENLTDDPDSNSEASDDVVNDKEENNDEHTDENKKSNGCSVVVY